MHLLILERNKMAKKKEKEYSDQCLLLENVFGTKEKSIFKLNGMCWMLEKFSLFRKTCEGCYYFKNIPPKSYVCNKFHCSLTKVESE